jgi:hypothetical protein
MMVISRQLDLPELPPPAGSGKCHRQAPADFGDMDNLDWMSGSFERVTPPLRHEMLDLKSLAQLSPRRTTYPGCVFSLLRSSGFDNSTAGSHIADSLPATENRHIRFHRTHFSFGLERRPACYAGAFHRLNRFQRKAGKRRIDSLDALDDV